MSTAAGRMSTWGVARGVQPGGVEPAERPSGQAVRPAASGAVAAGQPEGDAAGRARRARPGLPLPGGMRPGGPVAVALLVALPANVETAG